MNRLLVWRNRRPGAAVIALALTIVFLATPPLLAQQETEGESLGDLQTEETASMRESTYKQLAKAQEAAEADDFAGAIKELDKLGGDDLNSYEQAQIQNLYAFVYFSQERYSKAIEAYENLLAIDDLPEALITTTTFNLGQLYFQTENWRKAIEMLRRWMAGIPEPSAEIYEVIAQGYYQLEEYRNAVEPLNQSIELTKRAGKIPDENTYLMLRAVYYELKDLDSTTSVLHELIRQYPKRRYWMQLTGIYGEAGNERKQLSTLEIMYMQDMLTKQDEVLSLAGLLLQNGLPYRAGKILQKGIDDGVIESNGNNWRLLSQAWTLAHEDELAVPALVRAAELTSDGEIDLVLAQSYMNLDRWEDAARSARKALSKGDLRRPDQAYVMLGQALFNLDSFDEAREAFLRAQSDSRSRQLAGQWIGYIDREIDRRAQLDSALGD